jgi:hypothetical protein
MPEEFNNCEAPIEMAFDVADKSGQVKFLGLSQRPDESDDESDEELAGLFDWTCQACGAANQDSVVLKPQQTFFATWTCSHCARVTFVRFRAWTVAEWIVQHTMAVADKVMNAPAKDRQAVACGAGRGKRPGYGRQRVLVWLAVLGLAVVLLLSVLDMRRVSKSSAALQTSVKSVLFGTGKKQSRATPSDRIVGYWISEAKDHVMCFSPIDPVLHEGAYAVVRRGDAQPAAVQFKVVHEDTGGEELVIRKEKAGTDRVAVTQKEKGVEITYRVQREPADVTFNVAKDGKSMTRVELRNGEPVTMVYFNAGDSDNP